MRRPAMTKGCETAYFHYTCYDLTFRSAIAFPELDPSSPGKANVEILQDRALIDPDRADKLHADVGQNSPFFNLPNVAQIRIENEQTIRIAPVDRVSLAILSLPVLGPVLAILLHYRGLLVLHGSAVVINDRLTLFLGDRGMGKSTTAAFLVSKDFD